jgi:hypothetical protein
VVGECRPEGPAHEPRFHALKPTLSFNCFLCPLLVQDRGTQQRERARRACLRRAVQLASCPYDVCER